MWRHPRDDTKFAEESTETADYLTVDGQWWKTDPDTLGQWRALERPDSEATEEFLRRPLLNSEVVRFLDRSGFVGPPHQQSEEPPSLGGGFDE